MSYSKANNNILNNNILDNQASFDCKIKEKKTKLDNIHKQLDDYYFELKDRLICLINNNYFEEDIEFFIIKMFQLDDKNDTEFNVISYISQLKSLNDELYMIHSNVCSLNTFNMLNEKILKLNNKIKFLEEEKESYKLKINKLTTQLETAISNNTKFSNKDSETNDKYLNENHKQELIDDNNKDQKILCSNLNKSNTNSKLNYNNNLNYINNYSNLNTNRSNNKNFIINIPPNSNNLRNKLNDNNSNIIQYSKNNNCSILNSNNTNNSINRINNLTYNNLIANNSKSKKINVNINQVLNSNSVSKSNTNFSNSMLNNKGQRNQYNKKDKLYSGNSDLITSKVMIDQLQYSTLNSNNNNNYNNKKIIRDLSANSKVLRKVYYLV